MSTPEDRFIAALRAKYRTPQNVLRQLALDSSILGGNEMNGRRRLARDENGEGGPMTAEEILDGLADALISGSAPETEKEILQELEALLGGGSALDWAEQRLGQVGQDRRRRRAQDEPADLPGGGMPRPGGSMTPLRGAADRRRARYAADAAPGKSFGEMFPGAAAVRSAWNP